MQINQMHLTDLNKMEHFDLHRLWYEANTGIFHVIALLVCFFPLLYFLLIFPPNTDVWLTINPNKLTPIKCIPCDCHKKCAQKTTIHFP